MIASDVMTRHVITVDFEDTIEHAAQRMLQHGISGLPVTMNGKIAGVITEGDLLRRSETHTVRGRTRWLEFILGPEKLAADYVHTHSLRVKEVMSRHLMTVNPDTPLEQVVDLMEKNHIKRVPVLDGEVLVGIISRANLVRALLALVRDSPTSNTSDEAIRAALQEACGKAPWAPQAINEFVVHNGVVDLYLTVASQAEADAMRVAAENIPGVKTVISHIIFCTPYAAELFEMPTEIVASPHSTSSPRQQVFDRRRDS